MPRETMLEKMARAMYEVTRNEAPKGLQSWEMMAEFQDGYIAYARAALQAAREPCNLTKGMGANRRFGGHNGPDLEGYEADDIWRARIDAILAERSDGE